MKNDNLKEINLPTVGSSGTTGTVVLADNVDRVDGFHAFSTPRPGALLALGGDGKFPASALPAVAAGQFTGHHGQQFFGPTAYLARDVTASDVTIPVTAPVFEQDDAALLSRYDGYEYVRVLGPGVLEGGIWTYPVERGLYGIMPQPFPANSAVIGLGKPGEGGSIIVDSGSSAQSPYIKWRSNEDDGTMRFRGLIGKLASVPAGFRAVFPNWEGDWDTAWGFATENGFLRGGIYAETGEIAGDLTVSGTFHVQGPSDSEMTIGQGVSGWGMVLRSETGRPVIQALAPFVDAAGDVVSDVAFVIDNNGKPGLSYMQVPGTDQHRLEIGVDTLIGGNLRVGETLMVGTGTWGEDFAGIGIDSEWGLVGLTADDTFDGDVENGSYEVFWNKATGKLHTGGGAIGFGKQGMSLKARNDPDLTSTIKWYESGLKVMQFGSLGAAQGYWQVGSQGEFGFIAHQYINMDSGTGVQLWNDVAGTNNVYTAPGGGEHIFYVGSERVFSVGGGGSISLPITLYGTEVTSYWVQSGRLGMGTDAPEAYLHIDGGEETPQLRLSSNDLATYWQVNSRGTTWTTTGDVILGPATGAIKPSAPIGVNLGTPYNRFLAVYAAELNVETLVAQQKIATVGGRVMVAPTTQLVADVQTGDTVIFVKHNNLSSNDTVLLEAGGQIEAMLVTSAATAAGSGYRYSVTRNLDGTGANAWEAGAAVVNTGQTGSGWIDLYASAGLARATTYGPTIAGNVRQSGTWNDWRERWAIGNLNGLYGYGATTYGVAFGNPTATHITIDDTNGYRLRNNATTVAQWNAAGDLTLGATGAVSITAAGNATFTGKVVAGTGNNIVILDPNDATYRLWVGSSAGASAPFSVTQTGFVKATSGQIGGWNLSASSIYSNGNLTGILSGTSGTAFWAGGASGSAPFRVTHAGALTATSATITGVLTAGAGSSIGGFTATTTTLASGQLEFNAASGNIKFAGSQNLYFYVGAYGSGIATGTAFYAPNFIGTQGVFDKVVGGQVTSTNPYKHGANVGVSGTFASPTSITVSGGIITAIS